MVAASARACLAEALGFVRSDVALAAARLRPFQKTGYAVVLTDSFRLKPVVFTTHLTWQHLAASCAIPGVLPQYRIDGRWYTDGGLLNPLPVWAAIELGATRIIAIHPIWPKPAAILRPVVSGFVRVFGHHPPVPGGIQIATLLTPPLGSLNDAIRWNKDNIARWIEAGYSEGTQFCRKHFP